MSALCEFQRGRGKALCGEPAVSVITTPTAERYACETHRALFAACKTPPPTRALTVSAQGDIARAALAGREQGE